MGESYREGEVRLFLFETGVSSQAWPQSRGPSHAFRQMIGGVGRYGGEGCLIVEGAACSSNEVREEASEEEGKKGPPLCHATGLLARHGR